MERDLGDSSDGNRDAGWMDRESLGQKGQGTLDSEELPVTLQAGYMRACLQLVKMEPGKLRQRGSMAVWLTGWHPSLSGAGFGLESPKCFVWLIVSLGPNFQLEFSQSAWLLPPNLIGTPTLPPSGRAQSGGSNCSPKGPSGTCSVGIFRNRMFMPQSQ